MKKLLLLAVLALASFSFAAPPHKLFQVGGIHISKPFFTIGNRWQFTEPASWYGFGAVDVGFGPKILGQRAYLTPSLGVSQETGDAYARVRLSLDGQYVTTIFDCRASTTQQYCAVEASFSW